MLPGAGQNEALIIHTVEPLWTEPQGTGKMCAQLEVFHSLRRIHSRYTIYCTPSSEDCYIG